MTDLLFVLPAFRTQDYTHLIPSLEKNLITTTDLLSLDAVEIAKRAQLPLLDVKRLCSAVLHELQCTLGVADAAEVHDAATSKEPNLSSTGNQVVESWSTVSTLDDAIDAALGGGIPVGYVTEITGERLFLNTLGSYTH
jgi:DNA repair protein RAD57